MKSLTEYILESEAWWVPFKDLFQTHIKDIMQSANVDSVNLSKPMSVSKIGSNKSNAFCVHYTNNSGISRTYEVSISTGTASVGAHAVNKNSVVDTLVKDNSSKLPKLKLDRNGNILN